jgi:hypothetical protein
VENVSKSTEWVGATPVETIKGSSLIRRHLGRELSRKRRNNMNIWEKNSQEEGRANAKALGWDEPWSISERKPVWLQQNEQRGAWHGISRSTLANNMPALLDKALFLKD